MPKDLERDLGLFAVIAVSTGAMIGSGIFILPGLAMAEAGPAVILAFLIAAVLVLPAGVSIAELGTAMPDAGGDYVFIERGMGPALGTIAGLGTWLLLMLKGALALVGGMFYLELLFWLPSHTAAAVLLGTVLIGVNLFGVKQTGRLQSVMVVVMVVILVAFVAGTITRVDSTSYQPFFLHGFDGLMGATVMVLVSYAGVTKVAAVAEEIENPGRNLPLGLLVSLVVTALLYVLIVFVLVGTVDADRLADSNVPMADAVGPLLGTGGVIAIVIAAVLALVSTANAGLLTASRYPLALSRDDLLPKQLTYVHPRFKTPVLAILATGGVTLLFIVSLNVEDIAKTAGSFQILVYVFVNAALIAFRERNVEWYTPSFRSPAYPWLQLFGIFSGVYVLTRMETLPLVGAVGIIVVGTLWYWWYARDEVDREGVAVDAVRRTAGRQFIAETERQLTETVDDEVLIAVRKDIDREEELRLLEMAAPIAAARSSRLRVIRFDEVPDQVPLDQATAQSPEDVEFEDVTEEIASSLDVSVEIGEIVSHDTKHAVVNYAKRVGVGLIVTRSDPVSRLRTLFGRDTDWIMEHAPCDVVFFQPGVSDSLDEIAIVTDRSPFNDPLKVELANAIAAPAGARLKFLFTVSPTVSEQAIQTIQDYHDELDDQCTVPVESGLIRTDEKIQSLIDALDSADLVMLSTTTHRRIPDLLFTPQVDRIAARLTQPIVLVHSSRSRRPTFLEPIFDRVLFRDQPTRNPRTD